MHLQRVADDFAQGLMLADARSPRCKTYSPGIGPHEEPAVVALVLAEMRAFNPADHVSTATEVPYGDSNGTACDLCVGSGELPDRWEWALEVKAARAIRNNGLPADETMKQLMSPFADDRSALTDCEKVGGFVRAAKHGLLVYGYDYPQRRLAPLLDMLDALIPRRTRVVERVEAPFSGLMHPHHREGRVVAWRVEKR